MGISLIFVYVFIGLLGIVFKGETWWNFLNLLLYLNNFAGSVWASLKIPIERLRKDFKIYFSLAVFIILVFATLYAIDKLWP